MAKYEPEVIEEETPKPAKEPTQKELMAALIPKEEAK